MRILSILALFTLGLFTQVVAQVDIANARANSKTFIFDDDKHTVHGYIYSTLKEKTSCCGNDAIYLEVKFDQAGTVTSAKTLTGKNECYKKSVVDIVQNVKWDATGVSGTKTIYFEVKPIIPCSGSPGENTYKAVGGLAGVTNVSTPVVTPAVTIKESEGSKEVPTNVTPKETKTVDVVVVEKPAKEEDSFLSGEEPVKTSKEAVKEAYTDSKTTGKEAVKEAANPVKTGKETVKETVAPAAVIKPTPVVATTPKAKPSGPIKLPPQENIQYVSKGDVKPDESHNTTFANVDINAEQKNNQVVYADESTFAVNLRTALRKAGYCGLAHATVELETDPASGRVVNGRVLATNDPKVAELVPGVIKDLRFKPTSGSSNRYVYTEFKTEMVCEGQKPKYNLDQVEDFLVKPTASNK